MNISPSEKESWTMPSAFSALLVLTVLGLGGCFAVYTSMSGSRALYYACRQLLWLAGGVSVYGALSIAPFRWFEKYALQIAGTAWILLVLVLFFGTSVNGMRGWFRLGEWINFQPSEFAKAPFLLWISILVSKKGKNIFLKVLASGALFMIPVLMEPDMGSTAVFCAGLFCVLFVAGYSLRRMILPGAAVLCAAGMYLFIHPYAWNRIVGYLNPDADPGAAGWHIKQFQYTIAHGGLFGSKPGAVSWADAYLPLAHSDSAFASIVESGGFAGGLIVIAGFILLAFVFRGMALESKSQAAKIYIFSAGCMCTVQALLHIGVNAALIPPTGLTLPIFSYGGSSLFGTMILFGIAASAAGAGKNHRE